MKTKKLLRLSDLTKYSRNRLQILATRGLININRLNDIEYINRIVPLLKLRRTFSSFGVRLKEAA